MSEFIKMKLESIEGRDDFYNVVKEYDNCNIPTAHMHKLQDWEQPDIKDRWYFETYHNNWTSEQLRQVAVLLDELNKK
jgi:hypothetical protein